jgi:hypothetical protein
MLFDPKHNERLAKLEEQLRCVDAVTSRLMMDVIAIACERFAALGSATTVKVKWLIETGAWTDATIALLQLELPEWELRRLVNDNGEWLCSLSNQPEIPLQHDVTAEARHESLPMAILIALLRAKRFATADASGNATVPTPRHDPVRRFATTLSDPSKGQRGCWPSQTLGVARGRHLKSSALYIPFMNRRLLTSGDHMR